MAELEEALRNSSVAFGVRFSKVSVRALPCLSFIAHCCAPSSVIPHNLPSSFLCIIWVTHHTIQPHKA